MHEDVGLIIWDETDFNKGLGYQTHPTLVASIKTSPKRTLALMVPISHYGHEDDEDTALIDPTVCGLSKLDTVNDQYFQLGHIYYVEWEGVRPSDIKGRYSHMSDLEPFINRWWFLAGES